MNSVLTIHLDKIENNLKAVEARLRPGVQKMAVVKDEAYGHGMLPVARFLQDKVEWFCVACIEEAVSLRKAGIENPILVFEVPSAKHSPLYPKYDITASISDLEVFERLHPKTKVHLQFDTGMNRLGIAPDRTTEVLNKMKEFSELNYTGIYTHFACADEKDHASVRRQLKMFRDIRAEFPGSLMTHVANSGGIFYYPPEEVNFDAVRPGICLYGYAPGDIDVPQLQPAMKWTADLVQVKSIKKGDPVGYGGSWKAPEDGWLGIVPVGYSDGLARGLSNQFKVSINGEMFPQAGTVSMDYIAVYLGETRFNIGEEVTLLDEGELSAKYWAGLLGTIPYEITTRLSSKIERKYRP